MKRKLFALLSIFLCIALCLGTFGFAAGTTEPQASDEPADNADPDAVSNGPEEVIYARFDASGDPQDAYAVVALTLTEEGTYTHYGRYTAVSNLTDTSPIEYTSGVVTLTAPAGRYYYQGTLRRAKMPWDVEITYTLNGQEISPDELGGRSGELEVSIHTTANSGFDAYFTENYMLQISVTLDAARCENITTRNGTVASAGSDKTITFVVLPDTEGDVSFSADVSNFEMSGFTIAAVPYSIESMMDMSQLDTVTSGISQLTGAISQLTSGAASINEGAGTLNENSAALTDASDQIESALRQISDGLQDFNIEDSLSGLDQLAELPGYLTQLASGLDTLSGAVRTSATGYDTILTMLKSYMGNLGSIGDSVTAMQNYYNGVIAQLNETIDCLKGQIGGNDDDDPVTSTPPSTDTDPDPIESPEVTAAVTDDPSASSGNGMTDIPSIDIPSSDEIALLVDNFQKANDGLRTIADNIDLVVDGLMQMAIQISSGLGDMENMDFSAITELQTGMAELADNYSTFNEGLKAYTDGVGQLADGMDTYTSGMYALNSETQGIPDMVNAMLGIEDDEDDENAETGESGNEDEGDGESSESSSEVVSFLDERNTDTASVQFVISTDGISAPEQPAEDEPQTESQGFFANLWDKIVDLFT